MDKLIDKISSYNILNNLIPGCIFCYIFSYSSGVDILPDRTIELLLVYYFVGMVISRLGSLVVEPLSIKIGVVKYANHPDYITASKKDGLIVTLLETSNLYRTIAAGGLLTVLIKLYIVVEQRIWFLLNARSYLVGIMLFVLFLLSYRKQAKYIKSRVEHAIKNDNEE